MVWRNSDSSNNESTARISQYAKGLNQQLFNLWNGRETRSYVRAGSILAFFAIGAVASWILMTSVVLAMMLSVGILPSNYVSHLASTWTGPNNSRILGTWPKNFTTGIRPIPCHSHNDYLRRTPLFSALSVGCTGVEADIWLRNGELLVGHTVDALRPDWTLANLYLSPLEDIFRGQNGHENSTTSLPKGVYDSSPQETLVLLLDFKMNGTELWPYVMDQIQPLRDEGWLSRWNTSTNTLDRRPLLIVASGDAPFDMVNNLTSHDVFYDAPLEKLDGTTGSPYNQSNSYYASTSLTSALGKVSFTGLTQNQKTLAGKHISTAQGKGLISRYWDTPSWPISTRNGVWEALLAKETGMLNVDALDAAAWLDWRWCHLFSLPICS